MVCPYLKNKGSAVRFCLWPPEMNIKKIIYLLIQVLNKTVEFFSPGFFSENCKAIKKVTIQNNISIQTVYDIGCLMGTRYEERKKLVQLNGVFARKSLISKI